MKIKVQLSIGCNSRGEYSIKVSDESSRTEFLDIRMTPHDFAMALSGRQMTEIDATVRGLETVGKIRVSEPRSIVCPIDYDRTQQREWLAEHGKEPGWIVDGYIGSQSSVGRNAAGETVLNYRVYKYVDVEESK